MSLVQHLKDAESIFLSDKDIHKATVKTRNAKYFKYLLTSERLKGLVEPTFPLSEYDSNKEIYEWCFELFTIG